MFCSRQPATVVLGRSMASFRERSEDGPRTVSDPPFHQVVQSPEYLGGCEPCIRPAPCDRGIYGGATSAHGAQPLQPVSGYLSPARTLRYELSTTLMPGQSQHELSSSPLPATLPRSHSAMIFRTSNLRTGRLANCP